MTTDHDESRLAAHEADALLDQAGVDAVTDVRRRGTVLAAMRKAAEYRVAGVTGQKRRRHYGHTAELVATCVACDTTSETARWAAALKAEYGRFPALRGELDRALRAT